MASAKIVGFEVAPLTWKSWTRRSNSPDCKRSRDSVSSQIDTPALRSKSRRSMATSPLLRCDQFRAGVGTSMVVQFLRACDAARPLAAGRAVDPPHVRGRWAERLTRDE